MKFLIVNGDDFALTPGVNAGIARAVAQGIVRSATLMVHQPAGATAADFARSHPAVGLGLYIDLWDSVPQGDDLGRVYQRCDKELAAVEGELGAQVDRVFELVGRARPSRQPPTCPLPRGRRPGRAAIDPEPGRPLQISTKLLGTFPW